LFLSSISSSLLETSFISRLYSLLWLQLEAQLLFGRQCEWRRFKLFPYRKTDLSRGGVLGDDKRRGRVLPELPDGPPTYEKTSVDVISKFPLLVF